MENRRKLNKKRVLIVLGVACLSLTGFQMYASAMEPTIDKPVIQEFNPSKIEKERKKRMKIAEKKFQKNFNEAVNDYEKSKKRLEDIQKVQTDMFNRLEQSDKDIYNKNINQSTSYIIHCNANL